MVVAKRQRREKPTKIEQRKVQGLEWGPQAKPTALLVSPIYTGQAQRGEDKCIKGGSLEGLRPFFSSSFGSACPHSSRVYYPLFFLIILSYNTHSSLASNFWCSETELRKLQTPLIELKSTLAYCKHHQKLLWEGLPSYPHRELVTKWEEG